MGSDRHLFQQFRGAQLFRNSSGNDGRQERLIKTLGNLQDLRQRIYRQRKAEVVGGYGVNAQHRKYRPLATSHKSSCEASRRAECGKSACSVRRGGGWKPAYGPISEALPEETRSNR